MPCYYAYLQIAEGAKAETVIETCRPLFIYEFSMELQWWTICGHQTWHNYNVIQVLKALCHGISADCPQMYTEAVINRTTNTIEAITP